MNTIKNRIESAFKKGELISICLNTIVWNNRIIGFVKNIYTSGKFKIEVLDEYGQKRKIRTILFSSVKSLEISGIYNENLEKLSKNKFLKTDSIPRYFSKGKTNMYDKLAQLRKSKTICTFFFNTEYSIGIVKGVTSDELSIANIAYDGTNDGSSIFDIHLLTKIRCESNFEKRISFLRTKPMHD